MLKLRENYSILRWSCFQASAAEWFSRLFDIYRNCFLQYDLMHMMHYCSFIEIWSVFYLFRVLILHQFFVLVRNTECRDRTTANSNYIFGKRNQICLVFCGIRKDHLNLLECHNSHSLWNDSIISKVFNFCNHRHLWIFFLSLRKNFLTHFTHSPTACTPA